MKNKSLILVITFVAVLFAIILITTLPNISLGGLARSFYFTVLKSFVS